jgi:iron complex transport system substrate-binding protein
VIKALAHPKHIFFATVMIMLFFGAEPTVAQGIRPERVVSLNMCTDQLLLDLAPEGQIIGLSPFAKDALRSWSAAKVEALPILSGTAEEIMVLKPDLVVAGRFTKRSTREFIRARGIALEEFDPVRSIAETKQQILRFGQITGATERATMRVAEIEAAHSALRAVAASRKLRILPLSRRGWVAGSQSLISDILAQAGLSNVASELGLRTGGIASLEAIVKLRPDAILITRAEGRAEDQGSAMLLHPAIQELFPPERRIIIPERLTICGGPMLANAMQTLADQIVRLKPRDVAAR